MLNTMEIVVASNGRLENGNDHIEFKNFKIDSRIIKDGDFYIPLIGEHSDGHIYIESAIINGAKGIFVNSNFKDKINEYISINKDVVIILVDDTLSALQKIGKYNRRKYSNIESIAITGSVGKTSTREMVASVLKEEKNILVTKENFNGHIGLPLMALELENQDLAVLETGIDFVGEMDLLSSIVLPDVSIVTNIGTSHIGKFGSQEVIYNEKMKVANDLRGKKTLLLNKSDPYLIKYKNDNINIVYYDVKDAKNIKHSANSIEFDTLIYEKMEHIQINAIGIHNILNALVAIKVGELYDMKTENIIKGISNYNNFSRRMEKIKLDDITLIDDTYNASVSSTISGLKTLDELSAKRKIAVIADIKELGEYAKEEHENLGEVFKDINIDILITYGEDTIYMVNKAKKYVNKIYQFDSSKEAEEKIKEIMLPGDLIYFKGSNVMKVNEIIKKLVGSEN